MDNAHKKADKKANNYKNTKKGENRVYQNTIDRNTAQHKRKKRQRSIKDKTTKRNQPAT